MNVRYLTSMGIINGVLNLEGYLDIVDVKHRVVASYQFDPESYDPVIVHDGFIIHVNNFEYYKVDELIEHLRKSKDQRTNDENDFQFHDYLLETLIRDTDNVGIVGEFKTYKIMIPGLGIGLKSSNDGSTTKCLMIPSTKSRYSKNDWDYKIQLQPADKRLLNVVGRETFYYDALSDLIEMGLYDLVNVKKYREEHPIDS